MKTLRTSIALVVLSLFATVACQDDNPLEPTLEEMSLEDQLALELLADDGTVETALDLLGAHNSAAHRKGKGGWKGGDEYRTQAELAFREAQNALEQGNLIRARNQAREGREWVAKGMEHAGGRNAIAGLVEHLESLPLAVNADPGNFSDAGNLGYRLGELAQQARHAFQAGNRVRAGGLGVLSEQAYRHHHRFQHQNVADRAELALALGAEAIDLATELLEAQEGGATAEQQELLTAAEEFLTLAQGAFDVGEENRAAHLASLAEWWALRAVVLPDGITTEEVELIHTLAVDLLAAATDAVGDEPTELQATLLQMAAHMLAQGEANAGNGLCQGIGAFWKSAVISSYLIG